MGTRGGLRERVSRMLCLVGLTLAAIGHHAFILALPVLAWEHNFFEAFFIVATLLQEGDLFCVVYLLQIIVFASALCWDALDSGTVGRGRQGVARHSRGTRWARWGSWFHLQGVLAANAIFQLRRVPEVSRMFVGWWSAPHEAQQRLLLGGFAYLYLLLPSIGLAMFLTGSILGPRRIDRVARRP